MRLCPMCSSFVQMRTTEDGKRELVDADGNAHTHEVKFTKITFIESIDLDKGTIKMMGSGREHTIADAVGGDDILDERAKAELIAYVEGGIEYALWQSTPRTNRAKAAQRIR